MRYDFLFSGDLPKSPLSHRLLGVFLILNLGFLLAPASWLQAMALADWVERFRGVMSFSLLLLAAYWLMLMIEPVFELYRSRILDKHHSQRLQQRLGLLDQDEKAVLREFFIQRTSTLILPVEQPVIQRLVDDGILLRQDVSQLQIGHSAFAISSLARAQLTFGQLKLPQGRLTKEDVSYLKERRPKFIPSQRLARNGSL